MSLGHVQLVCAILVASVVLLIDSSMLLDKCHRCGNESNLNWAIACSCISFTVSIIYVLGLRITRGLVSVYVQFFAIFFLVWWTFGVVIITFDSPYTVAANGYLASWAAWCLSFYFCIETVGAVGSAYSKAVGVESKRFAIGVITLASIVEVIAGSVLCSKDRECKDEVAFSVAAGAISFIVCILHLSLGNVFPFMPASIFLFIWWTVSTGVLTFGDAAPFYFVGNGYLSTWICFIASLYIFHVGFGVGEKLGAFGGDFAASEQNPTARSPDDSRYGNV